MSRQRRFSMRLPNTAADDGLTLIECLVAIAVIGLTAAVIAPVMVFSVATRLQSQRAEQAIQLAQGEVDRIRLMAERGDFSSALASYPITTAASVAATGAPTSAPNSTLGSTTNIAKQVNLGNSNNKFAVQVFRSAGSTPTGSTVPIAFDIGVRVYDFNAVSKYGSTGSLRTDSASLRFTSGEGQRSTRPLAVIYTGVFQGDRDGALCTYRRYLNSTASTTGLNCS